MVCGLFRYSRSRRTRKAKKEVVSPSPQQGGPMGDSNEVSERKLEALMHMRKVITQERLIREHPWTTDYSQQSRFQLNATNAYSQRKDDLLRAAKTANHSEDDEIEKAVRDALDDEERKGALLSLEGPIAEQYLNFMQKMLDTNSAYHDKQELQSQDIPTGLQHAVVNRHKLRRLLIKLSVQCDRFPSSLFLQDVQCADKESVGGGGFADIFRGSYRGSDVALKRLRVFQNTLESQVMLRDFCREALLWRQLHHPSIQIFLGVDRTTFPSQLCMVSPWLKNGNILDCIKNWDQGKDSSKPTPVDKWLLEIALGLAYLHDEYIVHGDLRGPNILVDDAYHVRLTDFGLTVMADATSLGTHRGGATRWMAPELLDPAAFNKTSTTPTFSSDIYSFAYVCIEVYTGRMPFLQYRNDQQMIIPVLDGERPERPTADTGRAMSDNLWSLVQSCWNGLADQRPSAADMVTSLSKEVRTMFEPTGMATTARPQLPYDQVLGICTLLSATDIISLLSTCRSFYSYIDDESIWRELSARFGVHDNGVLGGRSFRTIYTRVLHTYGPLLGLWACDFPYSGGVVEFYIDPEGHRLLGEAWELPPLDMVEPYVPLSFTFMQIKFGESLQTWDTPEITWPCISWDIRTRLALDKLRSPSLRVFPETTHSIYLNLPQREPDQHPEFPGPGEKVWLDRTRQLPHLGLEDISAIDTRHPSYTSTYLYRSAGGTRKPAALSLYNILPTDRHLLPCPYTSVAEASDGSLELVVQPEGFFPRRFYPIRTTILEGIEPWEEEWHPGSLAGLWLGNYGPHGTELLFVDHDVGARVIRAWKLTGDANIPRGLQSWQIDLDSPIPNPPMQNQSDPPDKCRWFSGKATTCMEIYLSELVKILDVVIAVTGKDEIRMTMTEPVLPGFPDQMRFVPKYIRYKGRELKRS